MPRDTVTHPTGPRPVTAADPAWFSTGPVGPRDPDYGCVFYSVEGNTVSYTFDRFDTVNRFICRRIPNGPTEGFLEVQGRLFRVAGAVERRAAA
jgi:hypothetical protein